MGEYLNHHYPYRLNISMLSSLLASLASNLNVVMKLYKTYTSPFFLLHENVTLSCPWVLNSAFLVAQYGKRLHPAQ